MNLWTMIVVITAIATFSELYRAKIRANAAKSQEIVDKIVQRVARLEDRMANLETIVLEKERTKRFSGLE